MSEITREIIIKMKPVPKGRPRFTQYGHAYTPAKTLEAENFIKQEVILWMRKNNLCPIKDIPIELNIDFFFSIPKSYSKKKKEQLINGPHIIKPDCDNLAKLVCDALNGVLYQDDCLIYKLSSSKTYNEEDCIRIAYTINEKLS